MSNCPDSLIQATICKHVHLLQRFLLSDKQTNQDGKPVPDSSRQSSEHVTKYKDTEVQLMAEHLKQNAGATKDVKILRQRLRDKLLVLADSVQTCDDKSALQQFEKQLNSTRCLFTSLQTNTSTNHCNSSKKQGTVQQTRI